MGELFLQPILAKVPDAAFSSAATAATSDGAEDWAALLITLAACLIYFIYSVSVFHVGLWASPTFARAMRDEHGCPNGWGMLALLISPLLPAVIPGFWFYDLCWARPAWAVRLLGWGRAALLPAAAGTLAWQGLLRGWF